MSHPERANAFHRDPERAAWHDRAIWDARERRDRARAAVPEWQELRADAARIKRHTLSRLDDYLEQFEREAVARGAVVHWARTAQEHNEIVHGLLHARGVRRVVKSKSMLTEDCGLNPYLAERGVEVVDTDLGERIVQLRGEPPSHIVYPAIHLRRREIGELFARELGTRAGEEDPTTLTRAARADLRARFLAAEAGITGVNFAVAESGGLVVCTNEGNADLGTVWPPLHIASMGIEKVIPRVSDLGVFLRLLARSATGQTQTAYTSHFHGPRAGGELHVVLVDDGRSELLRDGRLHEALACIRCGACLNTCPVYRRSGGHSYGVPVAGPIGAVLAPARDPSAHETLPGACTLCGSCAQVCPVAIPLPDQLLEWRRRLRQRGYAGPGKRAMVRGLDAVLRRPSRWDAWRGLAGSLLRLAPARWRAAVEQRLGRRLPELPARSFRQRYREGER